jgi:hypothetical protein
VNRARATLLIVPAFCAALALAAAGFAGRIPHATPVLQAALQPVQAAEPPALAAGLLEPLANAAVDARVFSPISPPKRTLDAATAIDALDQALQQGELDPASWSTLVAAHAADLDAGDLAQLAACATDTERALSARLAALELLRASASREAAILDAEFEARLEGAAFGPDTQGITSFAAAATLAAFGGAQSRAGMLERLEAGADWRPTSVCLHGLREGADAAVLEQISARHNQLQNIVDIKKPRIVHIADKHFNVIHEHLAIGNGEIDFQRIFNDILPKFEGKVIFEVIDEDEAIIKSKDIIMEILKQANPTKRAL